MKVFKKSVAIASLLVCSSSFANDNLNLWNWSDYIADSTIPSFTKLTGIKPNYALFDSNELVEARLLSGHSGFDSVVVTSYYLPRIAKAGALQKIDKSKIPNYKNIDPNRLKFLTKLDPNNDYAIPYAENTVGIGYNEQKIKEIFGKDYKVDSWDLLFKKENSDKLKKCGIAIIDSPVEIISSVMHYLGKDPASENIKDYTEAKKILTELASNTAYFHSSRYINDLAGGEVCAVIGYNGDILQAADRAKKANRPYTIKYVFPKEGGLLWYDTWTITADAQNLDNTYKWLNFLLDKDIAKNNTDAIKFIIPVTGAIENLSPDLKDNPSINLSVDALKAAYFPVEPTAKYSRLTNRLWNAIKVDSEDLKNDETSSDWQ